MAGGQGHEVETHAVALAAFGRPERSDTAPWRTVAFRYEPNDEGGSVGSGEGCCFGHGKTPCSVWRPRSSQPFGQHGQVRHTAGDGTRTGHSAAERRRFFESVAAARKPEGQGKKAATAVAIGGGHKVYR
jgi:hypothetical protein